MREGVCGKTASGLMNNRKHSAKVLHELAEWCAHNDSGGQAGHVTDEVLNALESVTENAE